MPESRRLSEQTSLRTPWAGRRADGLTVSSTAAMTAQRPVRPTARPPVSIDLFNLRPREVRAQNFPIILSCARPSDRAPLAHPDTMPRARACRDQMRHFAIRLARRELECRALQPAVRLGS